MIEKIDTNSLWYVENRRLVDKLNEIIDHLNAHHGKDSCHIYLPPEWGWMAGSSSYSCEPEKEPE